MQRKHFGRLVIVLVLAVSSAFSADMRNLYEYADRIPGVVDKTGKTYGVWAPDKGGILFTGNNNDYVSNSTFVSRLHFSKEAIEFYKKNKWAALELEFIIKDSEGQDLDSNDLPRIKSKSIKGKSGKRKIKRIIRDTVVLDENCNRAVIVVKPWKIERHGWIEVEFSLKKKDRFITTFKNVMKKSRDDFSDGYTFQFSANLVARPNDVVSLTERVNNGYVFPEFFMSFAGNAVEASSFF